MLRCKTRNAENRTEEQRTTFPLLMQEGDEEKHHLKLILFHWQAPQQGKQNGGFFFHDVWVLSGSLVLHKAVPFFWNWIYIVLYWQNVLALCKISVFIHRGPISSCLNVPFSFVHLLSSHSAPTVKDCILSIDSSVLQAGNYRSHLLLIPLSLWLLRR